MSGTCEFSGCTKPVWVGEGVVHNYCGRTHACAALNRKRLQLQPPHGICHRCKLPGCDRLVYFEPETGRVHDFCCRTHAEQAKQAGVAPRSLASAVSIERKCSLPGCNKLCWVDERHLVHDFCGRSHAVEAKAQGIVPNGGSTSPVHWKDNGAAAEKEVEAEPETSTTARTARKRPGGGSEGHELEGASQARAVKEEAKEEEPSKTRTCSSTAPARKRVKMIGRGQTLTPQEEEERAREAQRCEEEEGEQLLQEGGGGVICEGRGGGMRRKEEGEVGVDGAVDLESFRESELSAQEIAGNLKSLLKSQETADAHDAACVGGTEAPYGSPDREDLLGGVEELMLASVCLPVGCDGHSPNGCDSESLDDSVLGRLLQAGAEEGASVCSQALSSDRRVRPQPSVAVTQPEFPPALSVEDANKIVAAVAKSEVGNTFLQFGARELRLGAAPIPPEHVRQVVAAMTFHPSMSGKANNARNVTFPTEADDPPTLRSLFVDKKLDRSISAFSQKHAYSSELAHFVWVCSATVDSETLRWSQRCCSNCRSCFSRFVKYPEKTVEWRKIAQRTRAGGQDWSPHVDKTFCEPCYTFFTRHGTLDNSARRSFTDAANPAPSVSRCVPEPGSATDSGLQDSAGSGDVAWKGFLVGSPDSEAP